MSNMGISQRQGETSGVECQLPKRRGVPATQKEKKADIVNCELMLIYYDLYRANSTIKSVSM